MSRADDHWAKALRRTRRAEWVTPAEHRAILAAVAAQADQPVTAAPAAARGWLVPAAACALVAVLAALWMPRQAPETEPAPELRFARMLDERLRQPMRDLVTIPETQPLEAELAALEADLRRLRPALPWSSLLNPRPESG
ncbi:MAG: hypothetical protein AAGA23_12750 [Pseudomonadota bacterium]